MPKVLSLFFLLIGVFGNGEAIICFHNTGSSAAMTNGTAGECIGHYKTCFSSMSYSNFNSGCGGTRSGRGVLVCNTDYCNSRTPSSISCFSGHSTGSFNATVVPCQTGISSCYSQTSGTSSSYSSCGICPLNSNNCAQCNTSNCNPGGASSISCYFRNQLTVIVNGSSVRCPAAFKSCYSSVYTSGSYIASNGGCGDCSRSSDPTCTSCSGDNCNSVTPSTIRCYTRHVSRYSTAMPNGASIRCHTGINTCYSLEYQNSYSTGGCGSCNSSSELSCTTCSTDNCNSVTPSRISCYVRYRYPYSIYNNGRQMACPTGFTTCYSNVSSDGYYYGDCGSCSSLHPNCTTCSGNYCNTIRITTAAPTTSTTTTTAAPTTSTTITTAAPTISTTTTTAAPTTSTTTTTAAPTTSTSTTTTTATPAVPTTSTGGTTSTMVPRSGIKCHQLSGNYISKRVGCSSTSCFEYQSTVGDVTSFHAGCGSCPARCSCSECRVCYSDFCNSGSVSKASVKLLQMLLRMAH